MNGFPLQEQGPGMSELFHDMTVEQEERKAAAIVTLRDHIATFWNLLRTETVILTVDLRRTVGTEAPDGPIVYWDGASFADEVAKALAAENERLRTALGPFAKAADAYSPSEDGDHPIWHDVAEHEVPITVENLRAAKAALHS